MKHSGFLVLIILGMATFLMINPVSASDEKYPTINAAALQSTITVGDPIIVRGSVIQGTNPQNVQVWLIGENEISTTLVPVSSDGAFEYSKRVTISMNPGKYYVIIHSPGSDTEYSVIYDSTKKQITSPANATSPYGYDVSTRFDGALLSQELTAALKRPGSDDTFTTLSLEIKALSYNPRDTTNVTQPEYGYAGVSSPAQTLGTPVITQQLTTSPTVNKVSPSITTKIQETPVSGQTPPTRSSFPSLVTGAGLFIVILFLGRLHRQE